MKGGAKARSLFLPRECVLSLSLSLSLSLAGWPAPPLSSSCLWVGMPSRFEDGFSCYLLNKVEL